MLVTNCVLLENKDMPNKSIDKNTILHDTSLTVYYSLLDNKYILF